MEPDWTFAKLWDYWNANVRSEPVESPRFKADAARYSKYVAPRWARTEIAKIKRSTVRAWIRESLDSGVGPQTMQQIIVTMRQALQEAADREIIKANPLVGVTVDAAKGIVPKDEGDVLDAEQFQALANAVPPRYRALVLLAGRLGITWAEALGLKTPDVDLGAGTLHLTTLAVEASGKFSYRESKKPRRLDLSTELVQAISQSMLLSKAHRPEGNDWLFISDSGNHPLRSNFNVWVLRPALRVAGLDDRSTTFHTLRHTAAAQMLLSGTPVERVSHMLGHSDVSTTKRYYGKFIPKGRAGN